MKFLYTITIFLGAFLLFTIQPLIGKQLLPWFGGGASIWTTLMLFYTTALFLGYLYAFFIVRLRFEKQRWFYLVSIGLTIFTLIGSLLIRHNLIIISNLGYNPMISPIFSILLIVTISIGLPYLLLSTTTTILQSWYRYQSGNLPYRLYAVSNIGSLIGLLIYPFIWEPMLTLKQQEILWIGLFFVFAVCLLIITLLVRNKSINTPAKKMKNIEVLTVPFFRFLAWITLSILSTAMLLITTSQITKNLPPVPLLWLTPLGLYLFSFIVAFSSDKWYNRTFHTALLLFSVTVSAVIASRFINIIQPIALGVLLINCLITGLVCHAELYHLRPHPQFLALYYLTIAIGGVIASIFCSIIAPLVFNDFWEMPIVLIFAVIIGTVLLFQSNSHWLQKIQYLFIGLLIIFATRHMFIIVLGNNAVRSDVKLLATKRNFYGVIRVSEVEQNGKRNRWLISNTTDHGSQSQSQNDAYIPTTYYTHQDGVGLIIDNHPKRLAKQPLRIGIIGLGVGTLAAYCVAGDYIRFYELNPDVIAISNKYFSYISHCRELGGKVDIIEGDGRLSLEQELSTQGSQQFDVLVVDAFTDDVVPVHLLTQEAIRLYLSNLSEQGVIALHLTNKYLDLISAVSSTVKPMQLYSYTYSTENSDWFLISKNPIPISIFKEVKDQSSNVQPWTDDYSNILPLIKTK